MPKKLTTEEFIEKAREKHGDTYNYSLVEYVNSSTKIKIICKEHGEFKQAPNKHLFENGCNKCAIKNQGDKKRKTQEQFIIEAQTIHNNKYDYSKVVYVNTNTKIKIICKEHGEFEQRPSCHLKGKSCPICGIIKKEFSQKKTQEQFIKEAIEKHGDRYDYSNVQYINSDTKIIIICKEHGEFEKVPFKHLQGQGCPKCSRKKRVLKQSKTSNQFIKDAIEKHGDKYDYSRVEYVNCHTKINIICKEHGEFTQEPASHLSGNGCPQCGGRYQYTQNDFIIKANKKHNFIYDYSKVNYKKWNIKVIIGCIKHGDFEQTPNCHLQGQGCPMCGLKQTKSKEQFIKEAIEKHGDKYDYSNVEYVNTNSRVIIICKKHSEFKQTPTKHLFGRGCKKCAIELNSDKLRFTKQMFISKAIIIHGDKYDYSQVIYNKSQSKVKIICKIHGIFEQTANKHLQGQGCPKCKCNLQTSKPAQQWIDYLSISKPDIQHFYSENGEFSIPNSKYKADGYDENTNTIYEFHGDFWHGNPKLFNKDEMNKITKTTFGELYEKTLSKEEYCKSQGYRYISLWENDWNKGVNAIRQIQRKFKEFYTS